MALQDSSARLQRTISEISEATTVLAALHIINRVYDVDFTTYHMVSTIIDIIDTPYVRTTYPSPWVAQYLLCGYVKVDPVLRDGLLRQIPFDWREISAPETAYEFLADAARHGVGPHGYSIPIVDKSRRALFSLNSKKPPDEWSAIVAESRDEWLEIAFVIHQKAVVELYGEHDPVPQLAARELECLHWTALGKDSKDIAVILGLSEHTTQTYLKTARFKLGAATISAAVARAIQLRLINPYGNTRD